MADWQLFRETYRSEITTKDWVFGVIIGVGLALCVANVLRKPDGYNVFMLGSILAAAARGTLEFRSRLRAMRDEDRLHWRR